MDGAARFNQRDALATILITAINIVAGFLIGVLQQGVPFQEALKTYTVLTVGDGLVTMIPSLLVSVGGGMVTRASSDSTLSEDLSRQLFSSSRPLWIAAAVMTGLALIPGLPKLSFILMAVAMAAIARRAQSQPLEDKDKLSSSTVAGKAEGASVPALDPLDAALKLDELMLEVGVGLVPLVDASKGGQLVTKVRALRKHLATQLGFLVPSIHIADNLTIKDLEYVVYLRGVEITR